MKAVTFVLAAAGNSQYRFDRPASVVGIQMSCAAQTSSNYLLEWAVRVGAAVAGETLNQSQACLASIEMQAATTAGQSLSVFVPMLVSFNEGERIHANLQAIAGAIGTVRAVAIVFIEEE